MPNYGLYQLTNSKEIPRFVGSAVPELTQASQIMQGRYDTSLQYEDAIDQGIQQATALGQDAKHLMDLKAKYKERLGERAKRGDYENMVRETAKDARNFINEYKPIAQNQALVQEYRKRLDEQVQKGEVTPQRAAEMLDYSMRSYKGLQKDPTTGQFVNQFQGRQMVKDLNMSEWVDKQLIGLKETTTGRTIQKDQGGFYIMEGSTRKQLDYDKQIKPILDAAKKTDPMYRAWVDQETLLSSYQAKYVPEQALKESPLYPQLQQMANQQGITLNEAYQSYLAQRKYGEIETTLAQMGNKYKRNDSEYVWKNMGETEDRGRAKKAEEEKNTITFSGLARVNLPGTQYATPQDLEGAKNLTKSTVAELVKNADSFQKVNGVKMNANGRYIDQNNEDVSDIVQKNTDMIAQALRTQAAIESRESRLRDKAGYHPNAQLVQEAEAAGRAAYNMVDKAIELSANPKQLREQRYQQAYDKVLQNTEGYKNYAKLLAEDAKNSSVEVPIQRFKNPKANTAMEEMATVLAQDLDIEGLKGGLLGLQNMDGSKLSSDDYKDIKGDTKFGGWFIDPSDGRYKVVFKVGKTGTSKGEVTGTTRLVKMDAGQDVIDHLLKTGESDFFKQAVAQSLGDMETTPDKSMRLTLPGNQGSVSLRRVNPSDTKDAIGYGNAKPQYEAVFHMPDGSPDRRYIYNTPGELSSKLGDITQQLYIDATTQKK